MADFDKKKYTFTAVFIVVIIVFSLLLWKMNAGVSSVELKDPRKSKGSSNAAVAIVEFSDFQCPACAKAQPVINQILKKFPGKVRVDFRHFPLRGHRWSKVTHQAAECAARQKKFWPYHDMLFENQEKWSHLEDPAPKLLEYASATGLNLDKFGTCLADEKVTEDIFAEKQEGIDIKIQSTPTFFINNKRFVGGRDLLEGGIPYIQSLLDSGE